MTRRRARQALRKPPWYTARRAAEEAAAELRRIELDRARRGRGRLALQRGVPGGLTAALEATSEGAAAFGAWAPAVEAIRHDERLAAVVGQRGRRALARELELFGDTPVAVGVPPPWHVDVRSGHVWEPDFHRRLSTHDLGRDSDVKLPWELSRLRHLVALAQAAAVHGDAAALTALEDDLASWLRANPIGWSINWTVAMEVALRAVNLIAVDATLQGAQIAYASRPLLVTALYRHGWFLARHLEISGVNGNHFLADAVGLVWLGRYFAGTGESDSWLARGVTMVERAQVEHVLPDGLDHEGSLRYHALVLELFLAARVAAGPHLAGGDAAIARMAAALATIQHPDGTIPNIGDDDGGRALALSDVPSLDGRRVLALAGALLASGDPDADGPTPPWALDAVWLTGRAGAPLPGGLPRPARLANGGVVVLGDGADRVVVDVGPIGFRGLGGHGHVDALSFEARLLGRLVVPDSGTGTYTRDPALRNRLRDAPAHTVVILDGRPYARIGGPDRLWRIDGDSPPRVLSLDGDARGQRLVAEQDLPCAAGSGRVRRDLSWQPGALRWTDAVAAPAGTAVAAHVQLPADARRLGGTSLEAAGSVFQFELPPGATLDVEPCERSRRYDSLEPGMRAVVRATAATAELTLACSVSCAV